MKRILIIGCCGAGKSTLALTLGRKLQLPVFHLDRLWWRSGWVETSADEFDAELAAILKQDCWVLDGNYNRTLPKRLAHADTVILLRYSRLRCLWRILKRWWVWRGRSRSEMPDGCPERLDGEFLRYVWNFNRDMLPRVEASLEAAPGCAIFVFNQPWELDAFLCENGM